MEQPCVEAVPWRSALRCPWQRVHQQPATSNQQPILSPRERSEPSTRSRVLTLRGAESSGTFDNDTKEKGEEQGADAESREKLFHVRTHAI